MISDQDFVLLFSEFIEITEFALEIIRQVQILKRLDPESTSFLFQRVDDDILILKVLKNLIGSLGPLSRRLSQLQNRYV
jgi:hypothetical protein